MYNWCTIINIRIQTRECRWKQYIAYKWKKLTDLSFNISKTLARTSHRPVRYTDASGILRNAGFVSRQTRKKSYQFYLLKMSFPWLFFIEKETILFLIELIISFFFFHLFNNSFRFATPFSTPFSYQTTPLYDTIHHFTVFQNLAEHQ